MRITICHRLSERSFFYKGKQFPVCARCTGVAFGQITAIITAFIHSPPLWFILLTCLVCLVDSSLQYMMILMSTNIRRFITGIAGGYGVYMMLIIIGRQVYEILT